jgi:hypothetical protein
VARNGMWIAVAVAVFLTSVAQCVAQNHPPTLDKRLITLLSPEDGARKCWHAGNQKAVLDTFSAGTGTYRIDRQVDVLIFAIRVSRRPESKAGFLYEFVLRTKFRDGERAYVSSGECGHAYGNDPPDYSVEGEWIRCSIECDGGHMDIRPMAAGLEIKWSREQHLSMSACGEGDDGEEAYRQKKGDRILELSPADAAQCQAVDFEAHGE